MKKISLFFVLIVAEFALVNATYAQNFTELPTKLPSFHNNIVVQWVDCDHDGDLDLFLTGIPSAFDRLHDILIYRNDNGAFTTLLWSAKYVEFRNAYWTDYEQDGDLDLILDQPSVYLNDGRGSFSHMPLVFEGSIGYSGCWVDYDNDGDVDWLTHAKVENQERLQFYRNEGNDVFTVRESLRLLACTAFAFGDYNNDGWQDLMVTGKEANREVYKTFLYENNRKGSFDEYEFNATGFCDARLSRIDYNNDGYQDYMVSGYTKVGNATVPRTKLYKNVAGSRAFVEEANTNLDAVTNRQHEFGDYDNDGDMDALLVVNRTSSTDFALYDNRGNGVFHLSAMTFPPDAAGKAVWGDYDNDGDLDFALSGVRAADGSSTTSLYRNDLSVRNTPPTIPQNLRAEIVRDSVIFSWDPSQDGQTASAGLTYNLRLGTEPGAGNIISPLTANAASKSAVVRLGNALYRKTKIARELLNGTYYWSVQALDNSYAASAFAPEQSFVVRESSRQKFLRLRSNLFKPQGGPQAWGDYDQDGDLDLVSLGRPSTIWRNDNGSFVDIHADLMETFSTAAAWGDYDNDGDMDLIIAGADSNYKPHTKLYRNLGNGRFLDTQFVLVDILNGSIKWGDYDNDGDLDVVIHGHTTRLGYNTYETIIYRNLYGEAFQETKIRIPSGTIQPLAWVDFDNDRDLDLSVGDRVFRNDNDEVFTEFRIDSTALRSGTNVSWGDYNGDGDLDVFVGRNLYSNNAGIFRLQKTFFNEFFYPQISACGDLDNDGDLDLFLSGAMAGTGNPSVQYLRNEGRLQFSSAPIYLFPARDGSIDLGDFDADQDLDILLTGVKSLGGRTWSELYLNAGLPANRPPTAPNNLASRIDNGEVLLSWTPASDNETLPAGLTYNLAVGTAPENSAVKSPQANRNTGARYIPAFGNTQHKKSWNFKTLRSGIYHWAVQAVDNIFSGSNFSETKSFTVRVTPVLKTNTLNFGLVNVGEMKQLRFQIRNEGNINLPVSEIISSNPFFKVAPASAKISPQDSATFDVEFHPLQVDSQNAVLTIRYREVAEEQRLRLTSFVVGPVPTTPTEFISLGNVPLREQRTRNFYIKNRGNRDLAISAMTLALPQFTISPQNVIRIRPGDSTNFAITFAPTIIGALFDTLRITHNSLVGIRRIVISGQGLPRTAVNDHALEIPQEFELLQNTPNPFRSKTHVSYHLPRAGFVRLEIYDLFGREIQTLVAGHQQAGRYTVELNGGTMPSGVYLYRLLFNHRVVATRKLIQMK